MPYFKGWSLKIVIFLRIIPKFACTIRKNFVNRKDWTRIIIRIYLAISRDFIGTNPQLLRKNSRLWVWITPTAKFYALQYTKFLWKDNSMLFCQKCDHKLYVVIYSHTHLFLTLAKWFFLYINKIFVFLSHHPKLKGSKKWL